jgi:hypothetical protein
MQIIKEYRQGYHLFQCGKKRVAGLSDPLLVYYDPPSPALPEGPLHKLVMQYKCHVHGCKATALLDTGAQGFFHVNRNFLQANKIKYTETAEPGVQYADGSSKPVHGRVTLSVHLQKYHAKLSCLVVDLDEQFTLILGQAWLQQHDAVLYMASGTATVKHKGKTVTLSNLGPYRVSPIEDPAADEEVPLGTELPRIAAITHNQAKRAVKKGGHALLVLVKEASPEPPPTANPSRLQQSKQEFSDIFKTELPGPPPHRSEVEVEAIRLTDEHIKYRPMPRYSMKEKETIQNEIKTLLSKGFDPAQQ